MKTVIYLDELLLTNFLAAAALLLGAGLLCARQCSGLRLMAGSAAAAAASLGILLPELPEPAAFLYKVFTCCAAVAAASLVAASCGFSISTPAAILSIGICFPITPVDATRTESSGMESAADAASAVFLQ